jgi:hypothetical protein
MANSYVVTGQGRLWIAPRTSAGISGAFTEVGDTDNFALNIAQTFTDVFESQTGARTNVVHAVTQTDASVTLDVLNMSKENLAKAFYGSTAAVVGATVTDEAQVTYTGGTNWIVPGSTSVSLKKAPSTALTLDTDYTYDASNGRITFLTGSSIITGASAQNILITYTHTGLTGKTQAITQGLAEYALTFEQVNYDGTVSRYELHRVALDMAKTFNMIMTGVNKLTVTGKLLQAQEITTSGLSKYFTVIQK